MHGLPLDTAKLLVVWKIRVANNDEPDWTTDTYAWFYTVLLSYIRYTVT